MASDFSRSRIDQFYFSKKRRAMSPGAKSGEVEEDVRSGKDVSPSVKGSSKGFLVSTESEGVGGKLGPVRRNLTSEIGSLIRCERKELVVSSEVGFRAEKGGSGLGGGGGGERLELKKFAADFLSLYCSGLPSSALPDKPSDGLKRQGSPLVVEDKGSKKRHCVGDDQLELVANDNNDDIRAANVCHVIVKDQSQHESPLKEAPAEVANSMLSGPASLRKCSKAIDPSLSKMECATPCTLLVNSSKRETPKSTNGSSRSSPGEAFWCEAIQLADGLFFQNNPKPVLPVGPNGMVVQNEESSVNMTKRYFSGTLKEKVGDGGRCEFHAEDGGSLVPMKMLEKHAHEDASPLPVKHFDFSIDEKHTDESTCAFHADDADASAKNAGGHLESSFVDHNELNMGKGIPAGGKPGAYSAAKGVPLRTNITEAFELVTNQLILGHDSISSDSPESGKDVLVVNTVDGGASTPSSLLPIKDCLDLSNWLPPQICDIYRKKGISQLYPWQADCLQVDGVLQNKNLVYCASTSAGKSFVAEILMLRRVIGTEKMALLVLPYVSICAEKAEHLESLLEPLGKHVRSYYGNQGGGVLPKDTSVAVCTIEKANSLLNRLLEEDRLSEVGIVVIDELHMVADPSRGYLLELMLTKLRYAAGEGDVQSPPSEGSSGTSIGRGDAAHGLQIVGMSATMPNVAAVADWLHAALYQTVFRPVPLEEYIKVGNSIYDKNMEIRRTLPKAADLGGKDPDHVVELCNEVVQEGHSVLLFCSSRKGCESTARHVSKYLNKFSAITLDENDFLDTSSAIDALRRCPVGLDPVLEETLPCGVAYHHAGLTVEEREIVETCYRKGLVRVLAATSTLAAGVNLPARRVIFRQPRIGRDFIDGTRYRQMSGRAGRTGIDAKGESVLICRPEDVKRIKNLLNDSCPPLQSCLSEDKNGMTHAILEVVAGGMVQTANDIHRYVKCTLLNSTKPFEDVVKSAQDSLKWLCHRKFLVWNDDTKLYCATPLGRAAFGSSLSPEESLIVLDDLSRAREGFVLASDLHLVFLVTPTNVEVEPDWELFYERFMALSALDQSVGNRVGVVEPFLMRMAHGAPVRISNQSRDRTKGLNGRGSRRTDANSNLFSDEQSLRICKRFYVALMLSRLVQEVPVGEVCNAFKVARGMVQALQENAGRFASMVSLFCERLGWHDLEGLVSKFQNRICFGVRAEIVELTTIPYVKGSRARALYKAGLRSPQAIAEASVAEIAKALFETSSWAAQENSAQRHIQFGVAKKIKNGARRIVLEKAEEARVAAFSAFKSLGLDVPQFSRPLLSPRAGVIAKKEDSSSSSEETDTVSLLGLQNQLKTVSDGPSKIGEEGVDVCGPRKLDDGSGIHAEVNPDCTMHHTLPSIDFAAVGNTSVPLCSTSSSKLEVETLPASLLGNTNKNKSLHNGSLSDDKPTSLSTDIEYKHKVHLADDGPITASSIHGGIDSFLYLWDSAALFYFDVHFNKRSEMNSQVAFEVQGIAICWENSPVYYLSIPRDLLRSRSSGYVEQSANASNPKSSLDQADLLDLLYHRWNRIGMIMGRSNVQKFTWNLKVQLQVLKHAVIPLHQLNNQSKSSNGVGHELLDGAHRSLPPICVQDGIDMCTVAWILWPDDERSSNPNLEKEIKRRLSSEDLAAANRSGRWKNQMRRAAHNGCCRRAAQIRALYNVLWKLLVSEELVESLLQVEIPLVHVLADMEVWGIGVDMDGCLQARHLLAKKLRSLEKEAYKLAGMTFSLYMPADIANVLYERLKLPVPEGHNKGKQHASTDKHCLDLLRDEHPIVPIIKEHRTLAKLLNCTLGSICSLARLSMGTQKYTLHGHWLQTSTATGRLAMEEPNLQCVEHMVEFKMFLDSESLTDPQHCKINAREFFISTEDNWMLLTADYSQIELRLMAHFSKDSYLIELLSKPQGDPFTMIASRWTGKPEIDVSLKEREHTKRLVYGILYGMGVTSLAEQLNCSAEEAREKIQSFKSSFPGVASWLHEAVAFCRQHGYVKTLSGRKRFLSKIKFGNSKEKSKAQRQAVNSICQGSAADIIKIAMLKIHSVITGMETPASSDASVSKYLVLKGRCRILLQVHDELVLEVDPAFVKEAGQLLKSSMETAGSFLVPLLVKLKVGRTWGSLEPLQVDDIMDEGSLQL